MINNAPRYIRYNPLQLLNCNAKPSRYMRYTTLWGVTFVTVMVAMLQMVPMPPFNSGAVTVISTLAFSLPKNRGKNHG
jgi:hypothetical protein